MRGVHCSWVDMMAIRQALADGQRGGQAALERMRCVGQSTVSHWKAVCHLLDAIEGKHQISDVAHFQPSHALEITRAFRTVEPEPRKWTEALKEQIAEWVDRCETEELTVPQLRKALAEEVVCSPARPWHYGEERLAIHAWLVARRESWPEHAREAFLTTVRELLEWMESDDHVPRRYGTDCPDPLQGAPDAGGDGMAGSGRATP